MGEIMSKYNYRWTLKDANFTKDKGNVFSCFSCGGGSTMGYKLAGFDVIGCNEIDPKMMEVYKKNHNPKYSYLEPIQEFKNRKDLPKELYNLDILDGSPPCSSFSMAGVRERDWGVERKFREGKDNQVLDTLFFDFIDLAEKLQPKVVIAENVKGILMGNAIKYVREIYKQFDNAGYYCQHFLLDASKMGVPQKRERVFFICLRKDLSNQFLEQSNLFEQNPKLILEFNEKEIPFKNIEDNVNKPLFSNPSPCYKKYWKLCKYGESCSTYHPKGSYHGAYKIDPNKPLNTLLANTSKSRDGAIHYNTFRMLTKNEVCMVGSFPLDYICDDYYYTIGMSVPPLMIANIASEVYKQWLTKIK